MENKTLRCVRCKKEFVFTASEQGFFKKNNFADPKRCVTCRAVRRAEKKDVGEEGKVFGRCDVCQNETILVAETGMCGPCTFGEAETVNGNW